MIHSQLTTYLWPIRLPLALIRGTFIRTTLLALTIFTVVSWAGGLTKNAHATSLSFPSLWEELKKSSVTLESAQSAEETSYYQSKEASLHWIPQLGVSGRLFRTQDPSLVFISQLNQRALQTNDFNPDTLNHPQSATFTQLSAGLDFPLFEGLSKRAQAKAQDQLYQAQQKNTQQAFIQEYTSLAKSYLGLVGTQQSIKQLHALQQQTQNLLQQYKVGSAENPVGYSGKLGLQNTNLRIESTLNQIEQEQFSQTQWIQQKIKIEPPLISELKAQSFDAFLQELNSILPKQDLIKPSLQEESARLQATASDYAITAERARFLPKVGLFAQQNFTYGSRSFASAYAAGLYLQWNLLDSQSLYKTKIARVHSSQVQAQARSVEQESQIQRIQLISTEELLQKNSTLLIQSEKLLHEQILTAFKLFKSGSISALQLSEVLNRRIDLILQMHTLRDQWIQTRTQQALLTQPQLPNLK